MDEVIFNLMDMPSLWAMWTNTFGSPYTVYLPTLPTGSWTAAI